MVASRKRLLGLFAIIFFVAAILCSAMGATRTASASEMPDCHGRSGGPHPLDRDAASSCVLQGSYGVLPKQFDIHGSLFAASPLFKANFPSYLLSIIPKPIAAYFEPKAKLYLLNSVFTI
jgi:hypothetical protein